MSLQQQNTAISQRLFVPLHKLVADNVIDPYTNNGSTELQFKIPKTHNSNEELNPALDFTQFNGTAGMKHPVSNKQITNYFFECPITEMPGSDLQACTTPNGAHPGMDSIDYPGMMCKGTNFKKQSEIVISNALRTPTQSRTLDHSQDPTKQGNLSQQTPIHYPNEIDMSSNNQQVWDNNLRDKKSCYSNTPWANNIFDVPVPKLLDDDRPFVRINSRDVVRGQCKAF